MLGSTTLEIAIGLVFVYWLLSLFCSALTEAVAARLKLRSRGLEKAIRQILGAHLAQDFFSHPLIGSLKQGGALVPQSGATPAGNAEPKDSRQAPSYIPSTSFAVTLFDLFAPCADGIPLTFDRLKQSLQQAAQGPSTGSDENSIGRRTVARTLLPIMEHCNGDLEKACVKPPKCGSTMR